MALATGSAGERHRVAGIPRTARPANALRRRAKHDGVRIDAVAGHTARERAVGQQLRRQCRDAVRDRLADRAAVAQRPVEPRREAPRRVVADRAGHAHDAIDPAAQRLGLLGAVAGVEHRDAQVARGGIDDLQQRLRGHPLGLTVLVLQRQPGGAAAVPADVEHGGVQLTQVADQLVDADGPARLEPEVVAVGRHAELALDRSALVTEPQRDEPARIRGEKQDHVTGHGVGSTGAVAARISRGSVQRTPGRTSSGTRSPR
ncbi:MAG TPA: hypothetical protein VK607_06060 [Kofleriaceae bacterium]|nr:hypothetical protein [Kofleriaceae bacterium]